MSDDPVDAPSRPPARIVVRIVDKRSQPLIVRQDQFLETTRGRETTIGREGDLALGVDPEDVGVSRTALEVVATDTGWKLRFANRNGAVLHLWAQAPAWIGHATTRTVTWPRVAVRVAGNHRDLEHWVLLECDDYHLPTWMEPAVPSGETRTTPRPRELTATQLAAVYSVFAGHLAWPPISGPAPRSLESAAHRLGVTPSAVRERLKPVQQRARELGLHQQFSITEPDYVYHLAAHGYLNAVPPPVTIDAAPA